MQRQSNQNTRSGPPGQLPETPSTISSTDKADHELDGTIVFEPAPSSDQDDDAPVEEMTSKAPPQRDETRPVVGEGDTRLQGDSHKSDRATSAVASSEEEDSGSESSSSDSDTSSSDSSSSQEEEEAAPGKADRPAANRRSRDPQNKAESENTMVRSPTLTIVSVLELVAYATLSLRSSGSPKTTLANQFMAQSDLFQSAKRICWAE